MKELQSDLDYCRKHHGGPPSAPSPADSQDATTAALPLRNESSEPEPSSENEGSSSTGDSDIERLIAPTRHLVVSPPVIISTFAPHTRTPLSGLVLWRTRQGSCALDVPPPTPTPPPLPPAFLRRPMERYRTRTAYPCGAERVRVRITKLLFFARASHDARRQFPSARARVRKDVCIWHFPFICICIAIQPLFVSTRARRRRRCATVGSLPTLQAYSGPNLG